MSLGVKLRRLRQQKNWSQTEVAQLLDISQPAYNKWETEQSKPNTENLLKIAEVFDIDLYQLLEDYSKVNLSHSNFNGGTNIMANNYPTINVQNSELLESVLKNQDSITKLLNSQNQIIEKLMNRL